LGCFENAKVELWSQFKLTLWTLLAKLQVFIFTFDPVLGRAWDASSPPWAAETSRAVARFD